MMKKRIFAMIAALATVIGASAFEYDYSVWVNLVDGGNVEYKFEDIPVLRVDGTDIIMELASTGREVSYPMQNVENFTFTREEAQDGAEAPAVAGVSFGLTADYLEAAGLPSGTAVDIYDLGGVRVAHEECDANGCAKVSIASLAKGVYAVSAGKHSFKFTL